MFYNKQGALLVLVLLLLSACATPKTTVMRAEKQLVDTPFCVEKNDKVIAPGVLEVIYDGLNAKGIPYTVFDTVPESCSYILRYTANQKWDLVTYLNHAEITVYKKDSLIASAEYDIPWGMTGGKKFKSTRSKISPIVKKLLNSFSVARSIKEVPEKKRFDARYDRIERLKRLYDLGALTAEEFQSEKQKVLLDND